MKSTLALTATVLTALTLTGCGADDPTAAKETPALTVGQPTPFDCDGNNCAATLTIEKAQPGDTCEELGATSDETNAPTPGNTRHVLIDTIVEASSDLTSTYNVGLEFAAVTPDGVQHPMEYDFNCFWPGSTNQYLGGIDLQPGDKKLWSQAFLLPKDATSVRVANLLSDDNWELSI